MNLGDYLKVFSNILDKGEANKQLICDILSDAVGIILKKEQIVLKNDILYIYSHPVIKNELHIHKNNILQKLNTQLKTHITDIR